MAKDDEFWKENKEAREKKREAQERANASLNFNKMDYILMAMRYGKNEEALQLIEGIEDKDINHRGKIRPITLLGGAVLGNCMDVAQVLLRRGADLNKECFDPDKDVYCEPRDQLYGNCTPFGMAFIDKNTKMIKLLVKHGANVNTLILGSTPLQRSLFGYFRLFHLDNDYFWSDNISDDYLQLDRDYLQLDDPKYYGRYASCLQQLPPGQNRLPLNNEGLKILNDCCSKNILKEMRFFIKNGADPNAKDKKGETVLQYLARSFSYGGPFDFELLDFLFEAGADPRIANNEGELPLEGFKLHDYVGERFPERVENYGKLMDMFQQKTDELNARELLSVE
jgi:ankyrin repeat protein